MLDQLRDGDTVIMWKLDRLARSTRDLLETMETIREARARFQSLSEPWANTTNSHWQADHDRCLQVSPNLNAI